MRRLISVFMMLCLLAGLLPAIPLKTEAAVEPKATTTIWTDYAASSFAGGDGSTDSPYLIATANQLAYLAVMVNSGTSFWNKAFELVNDIDLSAHRWIPIGELESNTFYGDFDGNGYTISGLTSSYTGLFGYADNEIKNLNLAEIDIDVSPNKQPFCVAGLAAYHQGLCQNVTVSGRIYIKAYTGNSGQNNYCGGIIGQGSSKIINCSFNGSISGYAKCRLCIGGIVATNTKSIQNCRTDGSMSLSTSVSITSHYAIMGGIVSTSSTEVDNCYSNMKITSTAEEGILGGLVGYLGGGNITNCYATGTISAEFSECDRGTDIFYAGGLVGYWDNGNISNCYTKNPSITCIKSSVVWDTYAGKLVGYIDENNSSTITNSYVSTATTLKRQVYQAANGCDGASSYISNSANSKSIAETGTFTYSAGFITDQLGWKQFNNNCNVEDPGDNVWILSGTAPTLFIDYVYSLRVRYWDDNKNIFAVNFSYHTPGSQYSVISPERIGCAPQQAVVSGNITENTHINVYYTHNHIPGPAPTCTTPQTCTLCGDVLLEPLPHNYVFVSLVTPECSTNGFSYYSCADCQIYKQDDYTVPLGHALDDNNVCTHCGISFSGPLTEHRIHVLDQETGAPIEGAFVTLDKTTIRTNSEGMAPLQLVDGEAVVLSITVDGYPEHKVDSFIPGALPDTYIYLTAKSTGIYEVRCNNKDVLQSVAQINTFAPTLTAEIVVKGRTKANITFYDLYQDGTVIATSTDGVFKVKNTHFRSKVPVYARMHTDSTTGNNLYTQKVNINVVSFSIDADTDWGKLLPFSAGMDLSFPGGTPIVEGLNFKIPSYASGKNGYVQVHIGNEKLMITFGNKKDLTNNAGDLDTKSKSQLLKKMRDDWVKQNSFNAWPDADKKNEVKASFALVVEFSDTGVRSAYGQANVAYNLSYEAGKTFMVWVIPVYAQISADFGGELQVSNIGYDFENAEVLIPDFKLSINGQITLQEGIGCSVISAGVYGTAGAALTFGVKDLQEYMSYRIYGELGLYARLKLFFWKAMEYRLPLLHGEFSGGAGSYARRSMYSLQGYETVSRDYLKNRSQWLSYIPRSGTAPENTTMQTSSYTAIEPKLVICGDTVMMVFADDDGSKGLNYQHLYYSLFQSNTGLWTQPKRVDDNALCDLEYEVCTDGSKIWIIYTQMDPVTVENQDASEALLSTVEVSTAVYDVLQDRFTNHTPLTEDTNFDTLPQITRTPEGLRAAWVSNKTNDVFSQNANNRLYTAVYTDGSWSKPTTLSYSGATVVSMDLGLLNDKAYIATVRDVDCDLSTIEDRMVVLTDENGNTLTVPTQNNTNSSIQFAQLEGVQQILWYSDANLYTITSAAATPRALFDQPVDGLSNGYKVISINSQESAIVFTSQQRSADEESSSTLQLLYGSNGQWNTGSILLTQPEADRYIEGFDVCVLNNKLLIPHISTCATVTDKEIQRTADFRSSHIALPQDLSVGESVFLPSQLTERQGLEVKIPVTNQSMKSLEQVNYRVTDQNDTVLLEGMAPLPVTAGQTGWLTIALPQSVISANNGCQVTVTSQDWIEDSLDNNSTQLELWYADLSVVADQLLLSGQQIHYAVTNEGNTSAQGTLSILLKEADGSETVLDCVDISVLEAGETFTGSWVADQSLCDNSRVILLRVQTDDKELYDFNNEVSLTLYPLIRESSTLSFENVQDISPEIANAHLVFDRYKSSNLQVQVRENYWKLKGIDTSIPITTFHYSDGGSGSNSKIEFQKSDLISLSVGYHELVLKYQKNDLYTEVTVVVEVIDTTPIPASIYAENQTVSMTDRPLVLGRDLHYQIDSQGAVTASYAPDGTSDWKNGLPSQMGVYQIRLNVAADEQNGYAAAECIFTLEVLKGKRAISTPEVTLSSDNSYRFDSAIPTAGATDGKITYGYSTVNDPATVTQWSDTGLIPAQETSVTYYLFARITDGTSFSDAYSLGYVLDIHIHTYEVSVTDPTCLQAGFTTHTCSICQESYVDAQISALGHSFSYYVPDNNATCTQNGTQTAICDRCDAINTQVLEGTATGHSFDEGVITADPSCTQEGLRVYHCHCGEEYSTVLPATGHRYEAFPTPPTCEDAGFTTYSCSLCGHSYTGGTVSPTGHSYDAGVITTKPHCTKDGVMTFTCNCGHQYTTVLPATGHEYVFAGTIPPKCEIPGASSIGCIHCGDVETTDIPPTGHSYTGTVTPPTCLEAGYITNVCDNCGKTETLPGADPLGHSFTVYHADGNATCTVDGTQTALCDRCTAVNTVPDPGSAPGHRYDGGSIVKAPDCILDGSMLYRCELCGDQYEELIPATGHRYEDTVTPPGCETTGYTTHYCTTCGDTFMDQITPATGHHYSEGFCQNCDILQPGYAIYAGHVESYGDAYEPITLELIAEGSSTATYTIVLEHYAKSYRFQGIPAGNYTLAIHKKNHVSRYFAVTISAGSSVAGQPRKICLLGDVTGEGKVNVGDVARLYSHIRKTSSITDEYALDCADVTGDGRLNVGDTATLYSHVKNTKKLY